MIDLVEQNMVHAAWGLLGALGMSSTDHITVHRAIEPESALILAALAAPNDARLADEARDWWVTFQDLVSRPVLKRRLKQLDVEANERWVDFAEPVTTYRGESRANASARMAWVPSGKTTRHGFTDDPVLGTLRYRAAFGVQARAGILQILAQDDRGRGYTADALARSTGYSKGAVREAVDRMVEARLVRVSRVANTDWFAADDPASIRSLAGNPALGVIDFDTAIIGLWALRNAAKLLDADMSSAAVITAQASLERDAVARAMVDLKIQIPTHSSSFEDARSHLVATITESAARLTDVGRPLWPW